MPLTILYGIEQGYQPFQYLLTSCCGQSGAKATHSERVIEGANDPSPTHYSSLGSFPSRVNYSLHSVIKEQRIVLFALWCYP